MTIEEAVEDIQKIYDAIQSFNKHIQDIDMSRMLEVKQALDNTFAENEIIELQPLMKSVLEFLEKLRRQ